MDNVFDIYVETVEEQVDIIKFIYLLFFSSIFQLFFFIIKIHIHRYTYTLVSRNETFDINEIELNVIGFALDVYFQINSISNYFIYGALSISRTFM